MWGRQEYVALHSNQRHFTYVIKDIGIDPSPLCIKTNIINSDWDSVDERTEDNSVKQNAMEWNSLRRTGQQRLHGNRT